MKKQTLSEKIFVMEGWNYVLSIPDVKQFIKDLNEFMKERTLIKKGFPSRIVFLEFEWKDFIKQKLGKELLR